MDSIVPCQSKIPSERDFLDFVKTVRLGMTRAGRVDKKELSPA